MHASFLFLCVFSAHAVPQFVIDLDQPPRERFRNITLYYAKQTLPAIMQTWQKKVLKGVGPEGIKQWLNVVKWSNETEAELKGIVHYANSPHVTLPMLKLWNLIYELDYPTFCTGLLAADEQGHVVHGRNMDYRFPFWENGKKKNLNSITYDVTYWRDGVPLMYATSWPGHIGIHTGMRFRGYSVNVNMRANTYGSNLHGATLGGTVHPLTIRKTLETVPDFDTAVKVLHGGKYIAPMYLIMAGTGPYEGAVLTLDRIGIKNKNTPGIKKLSPEQWYLVQTNDDLEAHAKDIRRPFITKLFDRHVSKDVGDEFMLKQLRLPPAFNTATTFSVVFDPSTGVHKTFLPNDAASMDDIHMKRKQGVYEKFTHGLQRFLAPAPTAPPHTGPPRGHMLYTGFA